MRHAFTLYGVINKEVDEFSLTYKADTLDQLNDYIKHLLSTETDATSFVFTIVVPHATRP